MKKESIAKPNKSICKKDKTTELTKEKLKISLQMHSLNNDSNKRDNVILIDDWYNAHRHNEHTMNTHTLIA